MSRLDDFIGRMVSQRACIDFAASELAGRLGPVLELGLGNGRTYSHMREKLPDYDIYVFERAVAAHPKSIPPDSHLILGEAFETLEANRARFEGQAVLIHADLGTHDPRKNDLMARDLSPIVEPLLAPGGYFISNDRMYFDRMQALDLPEGAMKDRCFLYQAPA